jgi:hypothetical protein
MVSLGIDRADVKERRVQMDLQLALSVRIRQGLSGLRPRLRRLRLRRLRLRPRAGT